MSMSSKKYTQSIAAKPEVRANKMVRWTFFVFGFVFLALAIVGVVLPGMPTTVFIILAGYCWSRSSERFHDWLMRHRLFGKMLADWHERRAMPRFAKYLAWSMMAVSCLFMFYRLPDDKLWIAVATSIFCMLTAAWMARLPDA